MNPQTVYIFPIGVKPFTDSSWNLKTWNNSLQLYLSWKIPEPIGHYKFFLVGWKYKSWSAEISDLEICKFQWQEIQGLSDKYIKIIYC